MVTRTVRLSAVLGRPAAVALLMACGVQSSGAGNARMMEQRAEELIELNREVIESIGGVESGSRVRLKARVVSPPGQQRVIHIDQLEVMPAEEGAIPELRGEGAPETQIRIGPIPDSEELPAGGIHGGGYVLRESSFDTEQVNSVMADNPGIRMIELKGVPVAPAEDPGIDGNDRMFLLFW